MSQDNFVQVSDARVAYRVQGQGPTFIIINGTGLIDVHLGPLVETLAKNRTVVTLDYSGSGSTTDAGKTLTIEALTTQVAAVIRATGSDQADLFGFSLGAQVATLVASEYPQLVRSLALLNGTPWGGDPALVLQFNLWLDLIQHNKQAFGKLILLNGFSSQFLSAAGAEFIMNQLQVLGSLVKWDGLERQTALLPMVDVRAQANHVSVPALVLASTEDRMIPSFYVKHLASLIPGARYFEIPSGHMALLENSSAVLSKIDGFLNG